MKNSNIYDSANPVNVSPEAEVAIIDILSGFFNPIAYMNPYDVRYNIERGCPGGMSKDDRTIQAEVLDFFINHFSVIYLGLIVNSDFRNVFIEAISMELSLDKKSKVFIKDIRNQMNENYEKKTQPSKDNYIVDFSSYDDDFYRSFAHRLLTSFDIISKYDDCLNDLSMELEENEMEDIGFIASNFMYLFRAFSKNGVFAHYVSTTVCAVEKELNLAVDCLNSRR